MAAAALVLPVLLCVRNEFLFTTRLCEDADMGANSILIEQARHFTLNPIWTFMMTSRFICTGADIAYGQLYWVLTAAPRGSMVIARLRQGVLTAGP